MPIPKWLVLLTLSQVILACDRSLTRPSPDPQELPLQADLDVWFPPVGPLLDAGGQDLDLPIEGKAPSIIPDGALWPYFKVTRAGTSITPDYAGNWIGHSTGYQESRAWGLRNETFLSISYQGDPVVSNQVGISQRQFTLAATRQLTSRSSASFHGNCGHIVSGSTRFTIWASKPTSTGFDHYGHLIETKTASPNSQAGCDAEIIEETNPGGGRPGGGGGGGEDGDDMEWAAITCWYRVYYDALGNETRRDLLYCEVVGF